MSGRLVTAADEDAEGRCHFTNAPVSRSARIDGKTGLYGVKVSAFSGREGGRRVSDRAASETLVSPWRKPSISCGGCGSCRRAGRPTGGRSRLTIASPTTAGLFGALPFGNDGDGAELALSDILRSKIETGKPPYRNAEAMLQRTRVARFDWTRGWRQVGMGRSAGAPSRMALHSVGKRAARAIFQNSPGWFTTDEPRVKRIVGPSVFFKARGGDALMPSQRA